MTRIPKLVKTISMSMPLQPELSGPRLKLRPLRPNDFEALYAVASDPLIWEQHPHPDRYQRAVFERFFEKAIESRGAFLIQETKTNKTIGSSRFYNLDLESNTIHVGYTFLHRQYWGGTTNAELKRLMLEHAFKFVGSVKFEIGENNIRSRRAIERIGARLVEQKALDGKPYVIYKIEKSQENSSFLTGE